MLAKLAKHLILITALGTGLVGVASAGSYQYHVHVPHLGKVSSPGEQPPELPKDPYFSSITLLAHLDGNEGQAPSGSQVGSTPYAATGTPVLSLAKPLAASAALRLDGASVLGFPNNGAFNFGSGDFTVEGWFQISQYSAIGQAVLMSTRNGPGNTGFAITYNPTSKNFSFQYSTLGTDASVLTKNFNAPAGFSLNSWHHVAFSRTGGVLSSFFDGALLGSVPAAESIYSTTTPLYIGGHIYSGAFDPTFFLRGYVDEIRITKGVGRYTQTFAPDTLFLNQ